MKQNNKNLAQSISAILAISALSSTQVMAQMAVGTQSPDAGARLQVDTLAMQKSLFVSNLTGQVGLGTSDMSIGGAVTDENSMVIYRQGYGGLMIYSRDANTKVTVAGATDSRLNLTASAGPAVTDVNGSTTATINATAGTGNAILSANSASASAQLKLSGNIEANINIASNSNSTITATADKSALNAIGTTDGRVYASGTSSYLISRSTTGDSGIDASSADGLGYLAARGNTSELLLEADEGEAKSIISATSYAGSHLSSQTGSARFKAESTQSNAYVDLMPNTSAGNDAVNWEMRAETNGDFQIRGKSNAETDWNDALYANVNGDIAMGIREFGAAGLIDPANDRQPSLLVHRGNGEASQLYVTSRGVGGNAKVHVRSDEGGGLEITNKKHAIAKVESTTEDARVKIMAPGSGTAYLDVVTGTMNYEIRNDAQSKKLVIRANDNNTGWNDAILYIQGDIEYTGNLTDVSDERLKNNVNDLSYGLDAINDLRPVSYEWKDKAHMGASTELGFLAQDVQRVLPELVKDDPAALRVNIIDMMPVAIKAIQELSQQNKALQEELAAVKAQQEEIGAIKASLEALELKFKTSNNLYRASVQ